MPKKIFFKKSPYSGYDQIKQTMNFHISILEEILNETDLGDFYWIRVYEENGRAWIYLLDEYKPLTEELDKNYFNPKYKKKIEEYANYCEKRFFCMPKLDISQENFDQIKQDWENFRKNPSNYLIITEDDQGKVFLEGKDEFSEQDKVDLEKEHKRFLRYQELKEQYDETWGKYSREWCSPADDEYCFEYEWLPYVEYP